jgi:type IX secretion system PorP/SprF family membrane protein
VSMFEADAQQVPLYSQYTSHPLLVNPAFAGFKNYNPLRFSSRQQWVGIEGAPTTQVLSYHGRIGKASFYDNKGLLNSENDFDNEGNITRKRGAVFTGKEALGGVIYNDKVGPINRSGIQVMYAYHTELSKIRDRFNRSPNISFSGSFSLAQFVLDESQLILYDANDPLIDGAKESLFMPDVNVGALLYTTTYFVGVSGINLMQSKIRINGSNNDDNRMMRHYFVVGGYKYETQSDIYIEPSFLIKATEFSPVQVDLSARVIARNVNAGITYRTNNDIVLMLGLKTGKYYFGYSFDYSFGNIIQYSSGSHEIVIGYNVGQTTHSDYAF